MLSERDPDGLELAERVLRHAEALGATQAEVLVDEAESRLTRFANSEIHQNVAESNTMVNLRFVDERRVGCASTNRTDDEALRRLAESAARIARFMPEADEAVHLPGPAPIAYVHGAAAPATADATPEFRAAAAREVIAAADAAGVQAYGSFTTDLERVALANSLGVRAQEARTWSQLLTVAMGSAGEAGYAEAAAVDCTAIDVAAVGREAADKARSARAPVSVPPGDYPVVLEPYAVVDLLDMLGYLGFSALAVQEGRSFFEPGKVIGSPLVTIVDDAEDLAGAPISFDYEGTPKRRVPLVEAGVCREAVYDAQTAARAGRESTGHGLPAPNPYGPFPLNMIMSAGTASREELIGGLERGLLVTRFHYTNPVHPKLVIVTGMTRDGTFLVEHGRIVGPVRNLRFTQSYLDALAGVQAVGRERRLLRGFLGASLVPALRIGAFTFTGATEH
ncbi:MAG TPA: TldD/PmbA family protein [Candidatus Baltobacteraceae bacterium]|nr:TldD/PmbA family protein [Candidatus Baltobacteraceae bacterium]